MAAIYMLRELSPKMRTHVTPKLTQECVIYYILLISLKWGGHMKVRVDEN